MHIFVPDPYSVLQLFIQENNRRLMDTLYEVRGFRYIIEQVRDAIDLLNLDAVVDQCKGVYQFFCYNIY